MYGFIYITTNLINGKKYIGQKRYDNRGKWKTYLGSGTLLKRAIKKYKKENFSREIIDEAKDQDELNDKEIFWIRYYNADSSDDFYNICSGGNIINLTGCTEEQLSDIKNRTIAEMYRMHPYGEDVYNSILTEKEVIEIIDKLLDGNPVKYIASSYGVSYGTISAIRNHKSWTYLTDKIEFPEIDRTKYIPQVPHNNRVVYQYNLKGDLINKYNSIAEVERSTGMDACAVDAACLGNRYTAYNYVWRFENDPFDLYPIVKRKIRTPVDMYDPSGNYIRTFNSVREAERFIGVKGLWASIDKPDKLWHGYKWKRNKNVA